MNRPNYFMYVFVGLMAFGILSQFASNPIGLLIPLAVFGVIFYLLRFPAGSRNWWPFKSFHPFDRNKKSNFKVYTNQDFQRKSDDDDQRPNRFH